MRPSDAQMGCLPRVSPFSLLCCHASHQGISVREICRWHDQCRQKRAAQTKPMSFSPCTLAGVGLGPSIHSQKAEEETLQLQLSSSFQPAKRSRTTLRGHQRLPGDPGALQAELNMKRGNSPTHLLVHLHIKLRERICWCRSQAPYSLPSGV